MPEKRKVLPAVYAYAVAISCFPINLNTYIFYIIHSTKSWCNMATLL